MWRTFAKAGNKSGGSKEAAEALAAYVTKELGEARSFSLDSPESRAKRDAARAGLDNLQRAGDWRKPLWRHDDGSVAE